MLRLTQLARSAFGRAVLLLYLCPISACSAETGHKRCCRRQKALQRDGNLRNCVSPILIVCAALRGEATQRSTNEIRVRLCRPRTPTEAASVGELALFRALLVSEHGNLRAVAQPDLAKDARDVALHGRLRDHQLLGDLAVVGPASYEEHHFPLALGQALCRQG